jgi:hypothetical protein
VRAIFVFASARGRRKLAAVMKTHSLMLFAALAALPFSAASACAAEAPATTLPAPQKTGGKPLRDALAARATSRDFPEGVREFTAKELSDLLWAAYGVNRADGKRTAPSAHNKQDVTIYLLTPRGAFAYDAAKNALRPVPEGKPAGDIRRLGGAQGFVKNAPLTLVYVSDFSQYGDAVTNPAASAATREIAGFHAGAIAQNAALHCASEGFRGGVRMYLDKEKLGAALGLKKHQWIVAAQSVTP